MKTYRVFVILFFIACSFKVAAYEVQLVSNEVSIEDDIRKRRSNYYNRNGWWYLRQGNMAGVTLGRTGGNQGPVYTGAGMSIVSRPVSIARTTMTKDYGMFDENPIQEFGEAPTYDANPPVGDAIVPLLVLMTLVVAYKKIKR